MKKILLFMAVLCLASIQLVAQERTVSGKVTSADGTAALPGVNVVLEGTSTGTITDVNGSYKLQIPSAGGTLTFSFIGLTTQKIEIGSKSVIDVAMAEDSQQLSEVVVTALGVSREKKALGYAVQSVDGETVAKAAETNLVNSLQGQVAGVQIQGTSGALGGSSRITIRGSNSFLGENQPLFVVDGMPINNDNYASNAQQRGFGGGSYDYGNNASDINPQDIESMSVLKGAAATALYGARGSNGVILITTKSGKSQKGIGLDFNSSVTFESPLALIEYQDKYGGGAIQATPSGFTEFTEGEETFFAPVYSKDGAWGPKYDPTAQVRHWDSWDPNSPSYGETRPWVAPANDYTEFFETGVTTQNAISFSGGNDRGNFRLGYTRMDQSGILPNSEIERNIVSFNTQYKLTKKLKVFTAGSLVGQSATGRTATGYDNKNPMQGFTQWWQTQLDVTRLQNYRKEDGTQYTWNPIGVTPNADGSLQSFNPSPRFFDNPYWVRYENLQEDTKNRFYGNFGLTYELAEGLSIAAKAMTDGFTIRAKEGVAVGGIDQSDYTERTRTFNETNLEAKILYNKNLSDIISLNAMLGSNFMHQERNYTFASVNGGLALPGFFNLENGIGNPTVTNTIEEKKINSVFATASIGYSSMIFLDLAVRNDWSSTLPESNNSYLYPSVSTSFVFTELPSLQSNRIISFGKVRIAYGTAASDSDPYRLSNVYEPLAPNYGDAPRYVVPNDRNNPNLKPEFTKEVEAGLEMNFFNNRVGFDLSYYDRVTEDQIFEVATSASTSVTSRLLNAGSMRNSGFEIMLRGTPIKRSGFIWDVNINFATYNNKVEELAEGVDNILIGTTWAASLSIEKGRPYMALLGQDFERNEEGKIIVDEDGMPLVGENREFLGSAVADFTGGIRNTFSYKGITVSGLVDFQKGGVIHSTSLQWAKYSGMLPETAEGNIREEGMIIDGVTEDGTVNTVAVDPQTYYQANFDVAAPNVYDADFVKLRELRVGYTLPNSILGKLPIRDLTFGFLGRNLAILHSDLPFLDPQVVTGTGNAQGFENAQVPSTRSMGFNLSFKL